MSLLDVVLLFCFLLIASSEFIEHRSIVCRIITSDMAYLSSELAITNKERKRYDEPYEQSQADDTPYRVIGQDVFHYVRCSSV